jgi:alkanesulfonate monooxygenase SsuD/methylene tetrahydromethanopterin reductase-like flavin-dependent oxidoreductase (luciferase family)
MSVQRPEREADHSHPSRAEVETEWKNTSTPLPAFMAGTRHLDLHLQVPVFACFVGAAAAAPTKHARTGTFVHMLGDFSTYNRA